MLHGTCSVALFTRGLEHPLKAAEAAVSARAQAAGVPMVDAKGRPTSFGFKLRELKNLKLLTPADFRTWTQVQELRNFCPHPAQPFSLPPAVTVSIVGDLATSIQVLFS